MCMYQATSVKESFVLGECSYTLGLADFALKNLLQVSFCCFVYLEGLSYRVHMYMCCLVDVQVDCAVRVTGRSAKYGPCFPHHGTTGRNTPYSQ